MCARNPVVGPAGAEKQSKALRNDLDLKVSA